MEQLTGLEEDYLNHRKKIYQALGNHEPNCSLGEGRRCSEQGLGAGPAQASPAS